MSSDVREFASWEQWLEAVNGPTDMPDNDRSSRRNEDRKWSGGSFKLANELAREGWPEGLKRIDRLSMDLGDQIGARIARPISVNDLVGDCVDVPAYLAGVPDCMTQWEDSSDQGRMSPIVKIGINIIVSAGLSHDVIFRKGAAIVALANSLELAGRRAEIVMMVGLGRTDGHCHYTVTVKRPDMPLDLDRLAFAFCHASSSRRLGFSVMETAPKDVRQTVGVPGGYGRPMDIPNDCDVFIGASTLGEEQWESDAKTQTWIIAQLKKQGVELQ